MLIKTKCCNEEMIKFNIVNTLNDMDTIRFMCGFCGKMIDINSFSLDDEELLSFLENESLENTDIYQELISEGNLKN